MGNWVTISTRLVKEVLLGRQHLCKALKKREREPYRYLGEEHSRVRKCKGQEAVGIAGSQWLEWDRSGGKWKVRLERQQGRSLVPWAPK